MALKNTLKFNILKKICRSYTSVSYKEGEQLNEQDDLYSKIILKVIGHDDEVLNSYRKYVATVCQHFDLRFNSEVRNKPYIDRYVLNKCPFIHKKSFKEYEIRTHEHQYTISNITGCTANVLLEYFERNIPEGVGMSVEKHRVESMSEHILKIINKPPIIEPCE